MRLAQGSTSATKVTVDNFKRAETDMYFGRMIKEGALGRFVHNRELIPVHNQKVIRANRDTLYSSAVFDLEAAPVTVQLPETGLRFCSMMVIDEDHYVHLVTYDAEPHVLKRENIGTRYVFVAVRTLVDPLDPQDLTQAHAAQNSIQVMQQHSGTFEVPAWDLYSQNVVRYALLTLGSTLPDSNRMFGSREHVDPVRHLIGTAMAWGGNPEQDAVYLNIVPERNDGATVYDLTVRDVPVDGFWSISVYNSNGYFEPNTLDAYSLNNLTAKKNSDGSVTVQFGGRSDNATNCLPITKGWNYLVRLYRPRTEILSGRWKFPEPQPVEDQAAKAA
jgi:hypothetical protein